MHQALDVTTEENQLAVAEAVVESAWKLTQ
jgi:hypothetical protein